MPRTVRAAARIELPLATCWDNLRDLTRATHYVPGLTNTVITTEAKTGLGASRIVTHARFGDMNETVIEWDEGEGFTLRLHKGDRPATPFKEASFRYALRPAAEGRERSGETSCEIHTSLTYELPFGALGRLADRLLFRRVGLQSVADTAVCLAEHYHTGGPVPDGELPRLRKLALPLSD